MKAIRAVAIFAVAVLASQSVIATPSVPKSDQQILDKVAPYTKTFSILTFCGRTEVAKAIDEKLGVAIMGQIITPTSSKSDLLAEVMRIRTKAMNFSSGVLFALDLANLTELKKSSMCSASDRAASVLLAKKFPWEQ